MRNIILIGMSGSGKTTVGKSLSMKLGMEFLDTDIFIEKKEKLKIEDIFSLYGEEYFRRLESNTIDELYERENIIISTGGGMVLNNNIIKLRENGIIILLESSIDNIINNIKKSTTVRPLLNSQEDIYERVNNLYENRKEIYKSLADFTICVDNKSIDLIIYEISERCVKINS
ncbi:shikimate kinase [Tissierella sp. MB52-C2]|uniref:shikimate kinase n=1 Tax=Tissierella sp. MB52-C2 TaxID=3070999 RepID=UPI00280A55B6|nr:shikimate kinase [Tissierella sp. MB52-C2]WMM26930.1 shikimate kinase [Tissierella sp. MB52-C2]